MSTELSIINLKVVLTASSIIVFFSLYAIYGDRRFLQKIIDICITNRLSLTNGLVHWHNVPTTSLQFNRTPPQPTHPTPPTHLFLDVLIDNLTPKYLSFDFWRSTSCLIIHCKASKSSIQRISLKLMRKLIYSSSLRKYSSTKPTNYKKTI